MPNKATKHIPKKIPPVGAVRKGRKKVFDPDTGKQVWRQGLTGFSKDWDGEPIARNYNKSGLKNRPKHSVHMGMRKKPKRRPE